MNKLLVLGSTGMLGATAVKFFRSKGFCVEVLNRDHLDFSTCSFKQLKEAVESSGCTVVVNCAGLISQRSEIPLEDFLKVNSILPRWLAKICESLNVLMFHPTTDCVYTGKNGPYKEDDRRDVSDDYGLSKALGEPTNCCVIRTSIIGEEKKNKLSFLEWVRSNKEGTVSGFTNHLWNGVTCLELCKIILELIEEEAYFKGTRHYFSYPTVSKADMVEYVNEIYNLNINVLRTSTGNVVDRSLASSYTTRRKHIKDQIEEQKEFWL